jgi:hypothetical protein
VLLVSTNGGTSYTEQAIALDAANESDPYVAAVDPGNADVVYVRTGGGSTSRLLVTTDAAKTFAAKYSGGAMLGFALSPDGSKVYLGGAVDGLQVASSTDYVFRQTSTVPVQCLRTSGSTLYVCSDEMTAGFTLGASADDGATIAPALHVANVRGPLACAPSSSTGACAAEWPALQQVIGGIAPPPPPADAGSVLDAGLANDAGDAGDAGAGASMPAPVSGCHCHAAGASRTEHGEEDGRGCAVMLAVAALSLARLARGSRGTPRRASDCTSARNGA